ncbi:adenylyl cyclase-associated protein 2 isoform X2 [Alligator mississippiensis]|uniref:adenylyl cyclase-associated protein 2 isoform X2 n=1 Tax=Alligator mississippiensis TaxID=8496 RepID=UPI0028772787|nr:adenylyl cyclase-associated protein 2 isoform X2 [Alligator mississippiensis]
MAETHVLMERLEKAVIRLESLFSDSHRSSAVEYEAVNGVSGGVAPYVEAFDRLLNGSVAEFLRNSRTLEGDVKTHAEMVRAAFQAQRSFLLLASQYQEPQEGPVASTMSMRSILTSGQCVSLPPPPPPPPGPPPLFDTENPKDEATASRSALFAQLNQGEAITRGLRHVSDDQKTHKNPSLRAQGPPVRSPTKSHTPSPTSPKTPPRQSHSPVLELEGKKWRVEYQDDKNDLVITDTELKQVAYIFKCNKSTLQIKGKINSITVDNCKKFGLVFDNVVGIVEVINSRDIQIQVMGKVPTISINKTEGCHIYLSEESLDCEIVSAKSSEMNILIPQDSDYKEFPVPEQFKTAWDGSKLVTEPAEIMC